VESRIIVDLAAATRCVLHRKPGLVGASLAGPPEQVIADADVLLVDRYGIGAAVRASRIAATAGTHVVVDFEDCEAEALDGLLGLAGHLLLPRGFAQRLTGVEHAPDAVRALLDRYRPEVAVVTCGAAGAWFAASGEEPRHQPAFAVDAVDTTGCGDVFHGAYA